MHRTCSGARHEAYHVHHHLGLGHAIGRTVELGLLAVRASATIVRQFTRTLATDQDNGWCGPAQLRCDGCHGSVQHHYCIEYRPRVYPWRSRR
jgi:hypothetical protein